MAQTRGQDGPTRSEISFEDFARLDLRIATVVRAEAHPSADRLLVLDVDDGSGSLRPLCAGIRSYYRPEDLVGRQVVIVANLAPRIIRGKESRGMLLAATSRGADGTERVVLLQPAGPVEPGSVVS